MSTAKKVKTERVPATVDQLAELLKIFVTLVTKIFKQLDRPTAQYWIAHERELLVDLKKVLVREPEALDEKLADWAKFYQEVFGLELDLTQVVLPAEREGFGWFTLVAKGLTLNQMFELCRQRFAGKVWRYYDDLDKAVAKNDREATKTYAIRVRDRVEADEEHKSKSANTANSDGLKGITLLERTLLELWYHWKTNQHLDASNVTICSGSRYAGGRVPHADWAGDEFRVGGVGPGDAPDSWRVREVVSL